MSGKNKKQNHTQKRKPTQAAKPGARGVNAKTGTKNNQPIKKQQPAREPKSLADSKKALKRCAHAVVKKHRRIDRAISGNIYHYIARTNFVRNTITAVRCLILGAMINCATWGLYTNYTGDKKQRADRFISGYYYPYAQKHNMRTDFETNSIMFFCAIAVAMFLSYSRHNGLNASKRAKEIERDAMRIDHIRYIAYATNVDCADLDTMYTELDDPDYRRDVLRLARGLAAKDTKYLYDLVKIPNVVKNNRLAFEIVRSHLRHNPGDITKLQPILIAKYIPAEICELYWEYKQSKNRMQKYKVGMHIKRQMRG